VVRAGESSLVRVAFLQQYHPTFLPLCDVREGGWFMGWSYLDQFSFCFFEVSDSFCVGQDYELF